MKNKNYPVLGVIGGSGLYKLDSLKILGYKNIMTPFGKPSDKILVGQYKNLNIFFLPRHGKNHTIPPHKINYKANIFALKKLGVTDIISISAVGSLKKSHKPGDFILATQYVDRTFGRSTTFFDDDCVAHVSLAHPVSGQLLNKLYSCRNKIKNIKKGGTYICIEGPQFSTLAESMIYKKYGCDVIGMTNLPEVRLAREAEIGYASIGMVTDYDCWHKDHDAVTVEDIIAVMQKNTVKAKNLLETFFSYIIKDKKWNFNDSIYNNLDTAIITSKNNISLKTKKKLKPLIERFLKS